LKAGVAVSGIAADRVRAVFKAMVAAGAVEDRAEL
jgi:hypothetical protein